MKGALFTALGVGLPLIVMMVLWRMWLSPPAATTGSTIEHAPRLPLPDQKPTDPKNKLREYPAPTSAGPASAPAPRTLADTLDEWLSRWGERLRADRTLQWTAAELLLKERRYDAAVEAFDRLLVKEPNDEAALAGKAMALAEAGRHEDAVPLYENLARRAPADVTAQFNHAVALFRAGEPEPALAGLRHVLQLSPGHAKARFNIAVIMYAQKRYAEALDAWRELTQGDSASRPAGAGGQAGVLPPSMMIAAWHHRGELALQFRNPAEAEACFLRAAQLNPRDALAWCNIGIARAEQVRRHDALTALAIALQLNPKLVPALNQCAFIHAANYRDTGSLDDGKLVVTYCDRSLTVFPGQANIAALRFAAVYFDPQAQPSAPANQ